jgi:hypothetical protein
MPSGSIAGKSPAAGLLTASGSRGAVGSGGAKPSGPVSRTATRVPEAPASAAMPRPAPAERRCSLAAGRRSPARAAAGHRPPSYWPPAFARAIAWASRNGPCGACVRAHRGLERAHARRPVEVYPQRCYASWTASPVLRSARLARAAVRNLIRSRGATGRGDGDHGPDSRGVRPLQHHDDRRGQGGDSTVRRLRPENSYGNSCGLSLVHARIAERGIASD